MLTARDVCLSGVNRRWPRAGSTSANVTRSGHCLPDLIRFQIAIVKAEGCMRRRDFIKVIVGSTAGFPLAARAQQPSLPLIGFLCSGAPDGNAIRLAAVPQ